jgi:hypothetical protein
MPPSRLPTVVAVVEAIVAADAAATVAKVVTSSRMRLVEAVEEVTEAVVAIRKKATADVVAEVGAAEMACPSVSIRRTSSRSGRTSAEEAVKEVSSSASFSTVKSAIDRPTTLTQPSWSIRISMFKSQLPKTWRLPALKIRAAVRITRAKASVSTRT